MTGYYDETLSAHRLRRCYEIAPPRVRQYLEAEIQHVLGKIRPSDTVLELGCGYGRVLEPLAEHAATVVGVDTSRASLQLAKKLLGESGRCHLLAMNAVSLGFRPGVFDVVIGIQNSISAFKVNERDLIREALRVTRPGGWVLLSSYSENFWDARLEWFELQAKHGLIGEIDPDQTGNGVIVCKDGFRAVTLGPGDFTVLVTSLGYDPIIEEVDGSSIFCEIHV